MSDKIYIGDVGTLILIDLGEDITQATNPMLDVIPPDGMANADGTIVNGKQWVPEIVDGTYLSYEIAEGDIDEPGTYKINPKLTMGTWTGHCDTVEFTVYNKGE